MEIIKNLIIDPTWPAENPGGDGGYIPAPEYPTIIKPDPADGDSENDDSPGSDPINNLIKPSTRPDIHSK